MLRPVLEENTGAPRQVRSDCSCSSKLSADTNSRGSAAMLSDSAILRTTSLLKKYSRNCSSIFLFAQVLIAPTLSK